MKILVVLTTDWVKRNFHQQHHLMELLSLRGHEIRVVDFELLWREDGKTGLLSKRKIIPSYSKVYSGSKVTLVRPSFVRVPILDYVSIFLSDRIEIKRQVKEFKPDIIVSFGVIAYIAGLVAKRNRLPFVYYWIDVTHRLIPVKAFQPIGWLFERRALKLADVVFTINAKLKEYVIRMGADPDRTIVLGAGIDLKKFDLTIEGKNVRKHYGIKETDHVLFFMGWLYNFAGLKEVAIELSKIKDKNPKIKLLIVGEGDAFDDLQKIREQYHLDEQIILTGKQPYEEIPEFIAAADICLLPAYPKEEIMQDIVPIKMYEYMAMGKPVITTKLPGVMKEFGDGNGVIYVDKPEDVLKKAIELVENGYIEEEGRRARLFVEERSWDSITDEFERVLEDIIQGK